MQVGGTCKTLGVPGSEAGYIWGTCIGGTCKTLEVPASEAGSMLGRNFDAVLPGARGLGKESGAGRKVVTSAFASAIESR